MRLKGLHHIVLRVGDVAASRAFAEDFGLKVTVSAPDGRLFLHDAGTSSFSLVLEPAATPSLAALAFEAETRADLDHLVAHHGASPVRDLEGPGGGNMVELTDPAGRTIRVVHGATRREAETLPPGLMLNQGSDKPRLGVRQHQAPLGAPRLLRLGHVGLFVSDWRACDRWYREVLGLLPSDLLFAGPPENVIGGFYRLNRGDEWVDHHTIAFFQMGKDDLHHVSFEVQNLEVQFMGHRWMAQREREAIWGVGRHPLGSHVFDVWRDPSGYRFETFSDTDLCNAVMSTARHSVADATMDLWSDRDVDAYFA